MNSKIAIIGVGTVGAATAYTLLRGSVCNELVLVDIKTDFRDGQVRDLCDATYRDNSSTHVKAGTYKEAGQCDIVVITIGSKLSIGETKLQTIYRNTAAIHSVVGAMKPFRSDTILVIVTSPVEVLIPVAQNLSGLPPTQVFGCGTLLDTVRLRGLLANKLGVAASAIDAYVLGEHGESQFVAWSIASVGGIPIDQAYPRDAFDRSELALQCRHEGQRTVNAKGAMTYGIGSVVSSICSSILFDKLEVYPLSHLQPEVGCSLSLPAVLGRKGIVKTIPLKLNDEEQAKLAECIAVLS